MKPAAARSLLALAAALSLAVGCSPVRRRLARGDVAGACAVAHGRVRYRPQWDDDEVSATLRILSARGAHVSGRRLPPAEIEQRFGLTLREGATEADLWEVVVTGATIYRGGPLRPPYPPGAVDTARGTLAAAGLALPEPPAPTVESHDSLTGIKKLGGLLGTITGILPIMDLMSGKNPLKKGSITSSAFQPVDPTVRPPSEAAVAAWSTDARVEAAGRLLPALQADCEPARPCLSLASRDGYAPSSLRGDLRVTVGEGLGACWLTARVSLPVQDAFELDVHPDHQALLRAGSLYPTQEQRWERASGPFEGAWP